MHIFRYFTITGNFSGFHSFWWQFTVFSVLYKTKMFLLTLSVEYFCVLIAQVSGLVLLPFKVSHWMYMQEVRIRPRYLDGDCKFPWWLTESPEVSSHLKCALEEERVCVSSLSGWWAQRYFTIKEPEGKPKSVDWVQNTAQAFWTSRLYSFRKISILVEQPLR